ncbi:hypothetical protein H0I23_05115 [Cellulophaga sp. HaHaR_3_176]|uniref:hypothetical protein n=1 Tax=Cellulophaga sp. HaHaR_3_176 TaxID=1942464 RepID=UPI001C1FA5BD|nr:hypothetical protein [Cellulophaga sp. HaHaR_3_176]QWX85019.1 hypothetical protein H0I23_05115 [Cellulophaga sp. HaHaR_3_176]
MKKIKSIYLVIISLILGLIISFIVTTNHYENKIRKAEHIIELQKKSANFLQKIEDYSEELKKEEANKNFLKMKIQTELVELNVLTTNDHKDYFSNATKLIVRNYFDHEKLKLEHERIAKLLDYYENEFVPCRVKIINEDFLIHEIAQSEKLTQE